MFRHNAQNPPIILDIEASGLSEQSYPIEIGFYHSDTHCYCALIKPAQHWDHWSTEAERLHGLSRKIITQRGQSTREVANELNNLLQGHTVFSDAWAVDSTWFNKLFYNARVEPRFRLSSIETVMTEAMIDIWDDTKQEIIVDLNIPRHRASTDAKIIQATWLRAHSRTSEPEKLQA